MGSIVLATDGSEYARAAARRAIELAAERDARLYVLSVVDQRRFNEPAFSSAELASIFAGDDAALSLNDVTAMAPSEVAVAGEIRFGVPDELIVAYADEVDADVIVIGEHGDHDAHFSGVGRGVSERTTRDVVVVAPETA